LLLEAVRRAGLSADMHERFRVGLIDVRGNWEDYLCGRSKNHRKKMNRSLRQLREQGDVALRVFDSVESDELEAQLHRAFEIEDRSWKGESATSVLRSPGMFDLLHHQSQYFNRANHFHVSFLELSGQPIAFGYGWRSKGVFHSYKIGYDREFASFGPGQLWRFLLLEHLHGVAEIHTFDCLGPLGGGAEPWVTDSYPVGRLVIAPRKLAGRVFLHAYKNWWPHLRRIRDRFSQGQALA
jgi:CelD/BcsL family acetyltransferase involved in cellulose biosynthesis